MAKLRTEVATVTAVPNHGSAMAFAMLWTSSLSVTCHVTITELPIAAEVVLMAKLRPAVATVTAAGNRGSAMAIAMVWTSHMAAT